jgi:hypothetical protein
MTFQTYRATGSSGFYGARAADALVGVPVCAEVDSYGDAIISKHRGDLEVPPERFDVGAQDGEVELIDA